jgi:hypothetical protein
MTMRLIVPEERLRAAGWNDDPETVGRFSSGHARHGAMAPFSTQPPQEPAL